MSSGRPGVGSWALLAGVVLACLIGFTGVVGAQEGGGRVVVVSDSIVAGAQRQLSADLTGAGWTVAFDAQISRTTYSAAEAVAAHRAELTDTVVLSLGVNDGADAETFRTRVESVLAEVRDVPRVFWVNLHEVRDEYATANRVLGEAASSHPNLQVLDWNSLASASPELTVTDGLHLTNAGAAAMTELIGTAVRATPATPATATPPTTIPATPPSTPASTTPATTAVPTTAVPDRTPGSSGASGADRPSAARGGNAWRSVVGWTVGGFASVVGLLVVAGGILAAWSLWSTRSAPTPAPAPSPRHPAVRARQRAERIAAAQAAAQES